MQHYLKLNKMNNLQIQNMNMQKNPENINNCAFEQNLK